jgi:hypothetical protein
MNSSIPIVDKDEVIQFFHSNNGCIKRAENRKLSYGDPKDVTLSNDETVTAVVARSLNQGFFNVKISFQNGKITEAHCNCPTGNSLCSHMAQVAFLLPKT